MALAADHFSIETDLFKIQSDIVRERQAVFRGPSTESRENPARARDRRLPSSIGQQQSEAEDTAPVANRINVKMQLQ
jgi:hypothetical protein